MTNWKEGEKLVASNFAIRKKYAITDTSDNPDYWHKDIDMLVKNKETGIQKSVEVKTDGKMHKTGNLFIELVNPRSTGGKGWYNFCEADYLAYVNDTTKECHWIPIDELRRLVNSNDYRCITTCDGVKGLLVPISDAETLDGYRLIDKDGKFKMVTMGGIHQWD